MGNNKDVRDKALDILLDEAAMEAMEAIDRSLGEPPEKHVFSEAHTRKMQKLFRQERRRPYLLAAAKFAKHAACFLGVLIVISAVAVGSVEAWRKRVFDFFLDPEKPGTHFGIGNEGRHSQYKLGEGESSVYYGDKLSLLYVPAGYELQEIDESSRSLFLSFTAEEKYFYVSMDRKSVYAAVDTEGGIMEDIIINGLDAVFVTTPDASSLIWYDETQLYMVQGNIEREELIKIAENLKKN